MTEFNRLRGRGRFALMMVVLMAIVWGSGRMTPTARAAEAESYLAVAGNRDSVRRVIAPYVTDGKLAHMRDYPDPARYLAEAPGNLFPNGLPSDLVLRIFLVSVRTADADALITEIQDAAAQHPDVAVVNADTTWLSYIPGELILQGKCALFGAAADQFKLEPLDVFSLEFGAGDPACIGQFQVTSGPVAATVAQINSGFESPQPPDYPDLWAEPNFLTAGAPGNSYVVGSPAAMAPGAEGSTTPDSGLGLTGQGVRVVIFDSSPYELSGPSGVFNVKGVDILVLEPYTLSPLLPLRGDEKPFDLSGHGTFVATPIVETVRDAEIILVKVLNDAAYGDVSTMLRALNDAALQALNSDRAGIVFNYSFGLELGEAQTSALWRLHRALYEAGIVQVAAGGNGSAYADAPQPMTLPAGHPDVIGVTSVAVDGRLACYANVGDIAAPGGGLSRSGECDVNATVVACARGSENCLVGWDPNSTTEQSYGIGTSFAAPLVSAVAAQLIEKSATGGRAQFVSPDEIWRALVDLARPSGEPAFGVGTLFAAVPSAVGLSTTEVATNRLSVLGPVAVLLTVLLLGLAWRRP